MPAMMEELSKGLNKKYEHQGWTLTCPSLMLLYNGLPVCAECERVNRYTVNFGNMLTLPVTYGKMFLDRKGCGRRWIEALKERGYGWRLRVVCDWQRE